MCGIVGKIAFKKKGVSLTEIQAMCNTIRHRGPDDQGEYLSPEKKVALGHQRLAVIDLTSSGHQPMRYLDRYQVVFNGEIYNFLEQKELLKKKGYTFGSDSDTEVLLALYAEYGTNCLQYLRGMFAFALYDEQEQILFCARDRVGKKPFKYFRDDNVFLFASELKAILTQPEYVKSPDYIALHHYLTFQYVPAELTGFKGIKKLRPAHYLLIDVKKGTFIEKPYWSLQYDSKKKLSKKEWQEKIRAKLEEATVIRMISDVPLGAFLSGGIDSSAIVALMSKNSVSPIKTFSIGFSEEKQNELPFARMIADTFGTDHTEFVVEPNAIQHLPELVKQFEEPFADSSALPTYLLSKLTRNYVTVALTGDGGDENFAGYGRYSVLKFSLWYEHFSKIHFLFIAPIIQLLYKHFSTPFIVQLHRFSESMRLPYEKRYLYYLSYFTDEMKTELYTPFFKELTKLSPSGEVLSSRFFDTRASDKVEQALGADFLTYLPNDLQMKGDLASMAVSLETRSPFLDHEFLELTAAIPFSLKLKGWNNKKYILKESLRGMVPDEILFRPKKGFSIPIQQWFRKELREYAEKIILSPKAIERNLFQEQVLRRILSDHQSGNADNGYQIWALLVLELWFQEYFDEPMIY